MQQNGMANSDTFWTQVTMGKQFKKIENCEDCAMGKLRQMNLNKETVE